MSHPVEKGLPEWAKCVRCPYDGQTIEWHLHADQPSGRTNGEFIGCDWVEQIDTRVTPHVSSDHAVYFCECVTDDHEKPHRYVTPSGRDRPMSVDQRPCQGGSCLAESCWAEACRDLEACEEDGIVLRRLSALLAEKPPWDQP